MILNYQAVKKKLNNVLCDSLGCSGPHRKLTNIGHSAELRGNAARQLNASKRGVIK